MPSINYTNMTPAQAHFAGRLDQLLEHRQNQGLKRYDWRLRARAGEHLDLDLEVTAFEYMPVTEILAPTIYSATYIDGEEVWRVWPARETVEQAGYDFETGQVSRPGIELPVEPVPVAVMEVPDGWTETALHVLMECSDLHPETILTQTRTEQVLGALEVDHPDHERLSLWLHDVEGETVTLRSLIENCEDWSETEQARHDYSYSDREEYAREWVSDHNHFEHWLMDCLDLEAVAGYLLDDMNYTEARDGELHLYEV